MSTAADIEAKSVSWLWPNWLPRGYAGVLDGDPGIGKSTLAAALTGELTRQGLTVLYMAGEDGLAEQLIPRLKKADADLTEVVVRVEGYPDNKGPVLPTDADQLRKAIKDQCVDLVVFDNIDHFGSKLTSKAHTSHMMQVAGDITRETNCSILYLRHRVKGKTSSAYRGAGSIGIFGGARFVWSLEGYVKPGTATPVPYLTCPKMTVAPAPQGLLWRWEDGRLVQDPSAIAATVAAVQEPAQAAIKGVRKVASLTRDAKTILSLGKTLSKIFK